MGRRVERRVLDAVSIDFSNVEVRLHFCHLGGDDVISNTPNPIALLQFVLMRLDTVTMVFFEEEETHWVIQGLPEAAFDQGDNATRRIRGSPVVLA